MEGLLGDVSVAAAVPGGRRRRVEVQGGRAEEDRYEQLLRVLSRLVLATSLRTRVLASVSYRVFRLLSTSLFVVAAKSATTAFADAQKALKESGKTPDGIRDQIGLPCVHVVNSFFTVLVKLLRDSSRDALATRVDTSIKKWSTLSSEMQIKSWQFIHRFVPLCRIEKMWDAQYKKLVCHAPNMPEICPPEGDLDPSMVLRLVLDEMMKDPKQTELPGVAPAGDLERQVQQFLDQENARTGA